MPVGLAMAYDRAWCPRQVGGVGDVLGFQGKPSERIVDAATALASAMADPSLNGAMELSLTCRGLTRRGDRSWPAKLPSFFGPAASSI